MSIQTGNILQVRLFDTPVLEFDTTPDVLDDPFGTSRLEIHDVKLLADKTLLPYGLVSTPDYTGKVDHLARLIIQCLKQYAI